VLFFLFFELVWCDTCTGTGLAQCGFDGLLLNARAACTALAALLAVLRTALALQCVSKARGWTGHVDRRSAASPLLTAVAKSAPDRVRVRE
jgi:hypothetical protein